jgi:hypothetical protein
MNPTHAFAYGALVKMAEHQVDPATFIKVAIQTQDEGAMKISRAILEYEKVAEGRLGKMVDAGTDMVEKGVEAVKGAPAKAKETAESAAKAVKQAPTKAVDAVMDAPSNAANTARGAADRVGEFGANVAEGRQGRQSAQNMLEEFETGDLGGDMSQVPPDVAEILQGEQRLIGDQNMAVGGAGALGLGGLAAADYATDPADTTANALREALGMQEQSNFGAMMAPVGDAIGDATGLNILNY